jgi:hypothetical protein
MLQSPFGLHLNNLEGVSPPKFGTYTHGTNMSYTQVNILVDSIIIWVTLDLTQYTSPEALEIRTVAIAVLLT